MIPYRSLTKLSDSRFCSCIIYSNTKNNILHKHMKRNHDLKFTVRRDRCPRIQHNGNKLSSLFLTAAFMFETEPRPSDKCNISFLIIPWLTNVNSVHMCQGLFTLLHMYEPCLYITCQGFFCYSFYSKSCLIFVLCYIFSTILKFYF